MTPGIAFILPRKWAQFLASSWLEKGPRKLAPIWLEKGFRKLVPFWLENGPRFLAPFCLQNDIMGNGKGDLCAVATRLFRSVRCCDAIVPFLILWNGIGTGSVRCCDAIVPPPKNL